MVAKWLRSSDRAYLLTTQEGDAVSPRGGSVRRGRRRERGTGERAPSAANPDAVSPVPDAVSDTQAVVSDTQDDELSTADTAKPKAASKRKGKGNSEAKKADAASATSVRDDDAAHAEFIAQFPTTDPDAVEADATPVSDVKGETDSEAAQDPSETSVDVNADDKAEPETDAVVPEVEASEAEVEASIDADDGEAETEGTTDAETTADGASDVATPEADSDESEAPEPEPEPTAVPAAAAVDPDVDGTDDPDEALLDDDDDDASSWVRPYVWTGGRTETTMDFAIETLVSAREQVAGTDEAMRDEHRRVLELCDEPRSVTEIAALLSVPLGVAKTLLGAMVEEDLVVVHRNNGSAAGPDLALMERVLRGLKRL